MTGNASVFETQATALDQLADELSARGYQARLAAPSERRPSLAVRNTAVPRMAERVMAEDGWFWWPWADRIAPVTDIAAAAERVSRVLAAGQETSGG